MLIQLTPGDRRNARLTVIIKPLIGALLLATGIGAVAQNADAVAIPVRKTGGQTDATAPQPADSEVASEPRQTAKSSAPASAFNTLQQSNKPLGLLKKRASSADPAPQTAAPAAAPPSAAAAPPPSRPSAAEPAPKKTVTDKPKSRSTPAATKAASKSAPEKPRSAPKAPDSMNAEIAALENLRPGTSSSTDSDEKSSPDTERSSAYSATNESAPAPDNFDQDSSSSSNDTDMAATPLPPGNSPDPTLSTPPPAFSQAAPPPAPVPNLYLPQPTPRSGGFLSRLFNRGESRQTGTAAVAPPPAINFTSDYAARDSDALLPAALPGYGINGLDLPIGGEDQYRLTSSLPTNFRPTDLVLLPKDYCHFGNALYLRSEAAGALCQMINAAAQDGLCIRVVSAFRDYNHQLRLYNRAVARGGEDQKSVARPGRSEHFLGTTVDLTNNDTHLLKRSFGDTPEGRWLAANAGRFGWKMTVMAGNGRRSHNDEPWHLRYLGGALNNPGGISTVAQQASPPQRRDVFGSIGRFLGLRR